LPVVVLGPLKAPAPQHPRLHAFFDRVIELASDRIGGIPIIDLRQVPLQENGWWDDHGAESAVDRFVDAYRELAQRLGQDLDRP
ncbi:MAG: hypothetical protein ACOCXJ_04605, partial [Planctomycetota bacterium]